MGNKITSVRKTVIRKETGKSLQTTNARKPKSVSMRSKIRSVGNSKGIILSNQLLQKAGLSEHAEITVTALEGQIIIMEIKSPESVNTDLSSWEQQFKNAIKKGAVPEKDLFSGMANEFDQDEWKG